MEHREAIERVMHLTGLSTSEQAKQVLLATVSVLGSCLTAQARDLWMTVLPAPLHEALLTSSHERPTSADQLYASVAADIGTKPAQALEHAQTAITVLAGGLHMVARDRIAREVPEGLAWLFREPAQP